MLLSLNTILISFYRYQTQKEFISIFLFIIGSFKSLSKFHKLSYQQVLINLDKICFMHILLNLSKTQRQANGLIKEAQNE